MDHISELRYTIEPLINFVVLRLSSNLGRTAAAGQVFGGFAAALAFSFLKGITEVRSISSRRRSAFICFSSPQSCSYPSPSAGAQRGRGL
jgi:hypothetical protein